TAGLPAGTTAWARTGPASRAATPAASSPLWISRMVSPSGGTWTRDSLPLLRAIIVPPEGGSVGLDRLRVGEHLLPRHGEDQPHPGADLRREVAFPARLDRPHHDAVAVQELEHHRPAALLPVEQLGRLGLAREFEQEIDFPRPRVRRRLQQPERLLV